MTPLRRLRSSEAQAVVLTVLAYGFSQVVIGVAAVVRIPLLVSELGAPAFGVFMVVIGLWPWLNAGWDAVRQATRVRVADSLASGGSAERALASMHRVSVRWSAGALVACVFLAASPILVHVGSSGTISANAMRASCIALGVVAALGMRLAPRVGMLEAQGRTAPVNLAASLTGLVGLPILVVALALHVSFAGLVGVALVGYLLPFLALAVVTRGTTSGVGYRKEDEVESAAVARRMGIWTVVGVLGSGLDTVAVALFMGPTTAGVYAVVQRLLAFALLIPTALGGHVTSRFARLRHQQEPRAVAHDVLRTMRGYILVGALVSVVFVWLAPACVELLTHGTLTAPRSLYLAMAGVILTQYATSPLLASLTSSVGLGVRNRIISIAAVGNIALTFVLASWMGTAGPAVATAVAGTAIAVMALVVASRRSHAVFSP